MFLLIVLCLFFVGISTNPTFIKYYDDGDLTCYRPSRHLKPILCFPNTKSEEIHLVPKGNIIYNFVKNFKKHFNFIIVVFFYNSLSSPPHDSLRCVPRFLSNNVPYMPFNITGNITKSLNYFKL
jgi:hypothetical protein